MKYYTTIFIIILVSVSCFAQKKILTLEDGGKLILEDSTNFNFYNNCGFCGLGCFHGSGKYIIQKNKITLSFGSKPINKGYFTTQIDSTFEKNDSISLKFYVYEDSVNMLYGANIYYNNFGITRGTTTNENGYGTFSYKKSDIIDTILVSFIGYETVKIPITNASQKIYVYPMQIGFNEIFNEVRKYKIKPGGKLIPIDSN